MSVDSGKGPSLRSGGQRSAACHAEEQDRKTAGNPVFKGILAVFYSLLLKPVFTYSMIIYNIILL